MAHPKASKTAYSSSRRPGLYREPQPLRPLQYPNDVWLFTDPDAYDIYERQGELPRLEQAIRFEVMRGDPGQPQELEYKRQLRRLLRESVLVDKGS